MTFKFAIGTLLTGLVMAGCAAPAAQESQLSSESAAATQSVPPSVSDTPTAAAPTATPSSQPTAAPTSSFAFETPDGILPPNSMVTVVVDSLQIRSEPGLDGTVIGSVPAGTHQMVLEWFGPVRRDGLDWYRLAGPPGSVRWAAAGSGDDRYLELVPPACPAANPDLVTLAQMTTASAWDGPACFGDRPLTVEGTWACDICDGTSGGDFEPFWLAYPHARQIYLWAPDYRVRSGRLEARVAPDPAVERPPFGSVVRATGHFNDPASTTCRMSTFDGEQAIAVDPRTAELYCRERFVIDVIEVIGTDPNFP